MNWQDLTTVLKGAKSKGLKTMGELFEYCNKHGLNTNAEKVAHFKA